MFFCLREQIKFLSKVKLVLFFKTSPTLDHNLRGKTLPGLEGSCRGNKGCCTELPLSIRQPGDGGPRR